MTTATGIHAGRRREPEEIADELARHARLLMAMVRLDLVRWERRNDRLRP